MMRDTAGTAEQLQIDCLDSAAAFDQLQAIWQGLERQDPQCTPFNTWVWNCLWWHHYGTTRDSLTLLIARQGSRVVGLATLYIHATRMCKVVPVKVLRFIGTGGDASPDYLNIVALPIFRNAAERAFLEFLPHIKGWQKLHLANMSQSSSYGLFHRAVIRHFFDMDALWLATMKLDGKIIGVQYIFVWRGELMFMQSGYSPEHESLSSGQVRLTYVIQRGIEQGMTGLDMLKGHHFYRSEYDRDKIYTVNHGYFRPGVHRFIGGSRDWAA